ncbi:MAG: anti-sigma factor antagonist [Coriobacteriales bacterium]|nr:anti-sigma factor antagonist [Coriobacteriales bacterium]
MRTELAGNTLTLYPEGRVDSKNAGDFESDVMAAIDAAPGASVVVDVNNLEYVSSAGLRVFIKVMRRANGKLTVINASPEVYDVFEVTGLSELMEVKKRLREISVDGCELIGQGGYGKVYRLDDETIAKIYIPGMSLEFVEHERDMSQKAFLMGVPTAISYDVVKCGDCYGVVFEMLDAKTTAQIIEADPTKIPEVSAGSARMLKELHQITPGPGAGLPNRKQQFLDWVDSLAERITEEEAVKLKAFINAIPDRDTFLHGDYNAKNIMLRNGEYQLIDIGDASVGHPIFDIVGLMLVYIILPNSQGGRSAEERRGLLGFDFEYAPQVWGTMCATYFGLRSQEEIANKTKQLMPYCILLMVYQSMRIAGADEQTLQARVDGLLRPRLLPAIEAAEPLDF